MTAPCSIVDSKSGSKATVTKYGQLVVAPVDYSVPVAKTLDIINTPYNFINPAAGQNIVITDIILTANNSVGVNGATITIFETDDEQSTTSSKDILKIQMIKQSTLALNGLNLIISQGAFVNATTDDDDIFITIMYYRVPVRVV